MQIHKVVNENLFEFKKGLDPIDSLGLGRRAMIEEWMNLWMQKTDTIFDYRINENYEIDLISNKFTSIYMNNYGFNDLLVDGKLPEFIQFNYVNTRVYIDLKDLTSLKGFPKKIDGYLSIVNTPKLTSLEYITPILNIEKSEILSSGYLIDNTGIKDLRGMPNEINCSLFISDNKYLRSLEGLPKIINGRLILPQWLISDTTNINILKNTKAKTIKYE